MRKEKVYGKMKKTAKIIIVGIMTLCMIAGSALNFVPANAATTTKSPFVNKSFTHNSRYDGRLIVNGVDTSAWQSKNCNWVKAKAAGVDYAIMRVTYSNYGPKTLKLNNDSVFENNFKNAKAAGVMCGIYVFSQAKNATEGAQEAEYAVKRLKALGITPNKLELPVYMDYEFAGGRAGRMYGISKTNATNAAVAFCNKIKSYGYTPGIYANTTFFRSYLDTSKFAPDVDLWCAQYYSKCESAVDYSKWQYASNGKINGLLSWAGLKGNIDVNYWYLNKAVNANPLTVIKGKTTLSVADAKAPKFTITEGSYTLQPGVDYIVGGIRNNKNGTGYAYIKGMGKYGGYALVPITIADKTSGSASANINGKCANYLTKAVTANSQYIGTVSIAAPKITFKKGGTYTVQEAINVRTGAGTNKSKVKRSKLSSAAKKVTSKGTYAVLKPGTKVKVEKVSGDWIKVKVKVGGKWKALKGGWICTGMNGEIYVK